MKINKIEINSFRSIVGHFLKNRYSCGHVVFRGVTNCRKHRLIPSLGRINKEVLGNMTLNDYEIETLSRFKLRANAEVNPTLRNDWEWLALAQHHGLPTRL